jgi:nucleoside-diphosphate-sugar epimerase
MRVFVTGATGFVGSVTVQELISAGHKVLGLARSDANAASLAAVGADVQRGSLADLDSLAAGAKACDGVIHTAFIHDFSKFEENCEIDRRAIEALGTALAGSNRPLIVTSGVALLAQGRPATEDDMIPARSGFPRVSEQTGFAMAKHGIRAMALRLPPSTHGKGDHGFVPILINIAREKGVSAYVGDGLNRWPATHRLDAARVYRLALEKGETGACYHAIAEEGVPFKMIAEVIGRQLNIPVVGLSQEEASDHFGWFARFAGIDAAASSERTRQFLGWEPKQPGLIDDLDQTYYFDA